MTKLKKKDEENLIKKDGKYTISLNIEFNKFRDDLFRVKSAEVICDNDDGSQTIVKFNAIKDSTDPMRLIPTSGVSGEILIKDSSNKAERIDYFEENVFLSQRTYIRYDCFEHDGLYDFIQAGTMGTIYRDSKTFREIYTNAAKKIYDVICEEKHKEAKRKEEKDTELRKKIQGFDD